MHLKEKSTGFMDGWIVDRGRQVLDMFANHSKCKISELMDIPNIDGECSKASSWWNHYHHGDNGTFNCFTAPEDDLN